MQRSKPCEGGHWLIESFPKQKATEVNISLAEEANRQVQNHRGRYLKKVSRLLSPSAATEVIQSFNSYDVTEVVIIFLVEEALQPFRGYAITEANMDLQ
jgi:hypothetical protein